MNLKTSVNCSFIQIMILPSCKIKNGKQKKQEFILEVFIGTWLFLLLT